MSPGPTNCGWYTNDRAPPPLTSSIASARDAREPSTPVTRGALQPPAEVSATDGAEASGRLGWSDNLKVATVAEVVVHDTGRAVVIDSLAGALLGERGAVQRLPETWTRSAGWIAGGGVLGSFVLGGLHLAVSGTLDPMPGGWHWASVILALIETVTAIGSRSGWSTMSAERAAARPSYLSLGYADKP
jgi:hypothetical protein